MSGSTQVNKNKRIVAFVRLFIGITFDFWRESRIIRRQGTKAARSRMSAIHRKRAVQFRETALKLGGVLIKLGQFLGTRADVMPEEYLSELAKLRDEVPQAPFNEIQSLLEAEFGMPMGEVFSNFSKESEGAASLAQVHRAVLKNGEKVAVKIQRPQIEDYINIDLGIFSYLMDGLYRFTKAGRRYDIPGLVEEFARTLGDELDFYREGFYAERFRQNFRDSTIISIPKVYWEYTRDRVLTLEAIEGIKIWDFESIKESGINRNEVAHEVFQSFLKMVLDDGFFHADPHPGNLFVLPGPRITYVDFGMVGEITPEMRELFKEGTIAVIKRDINSLVVTLQKLGFIRHGANLAPIKSTLEWLFDNYSQLTSNELDFEKLELIQEDIRKIMYEQPLTIPSQFAFLGRAAGTLQGLISGLDQKFDFIDSARPYMEDMVERMKPPLVEIVANEAKDMAKIFLALPYQIQRVLGKMERGELKTRTDTIEIVNAINWANRGRNAIALAIIFASLIFGGIVLVIYGRDFMSNILFIGAVLVGVLVGLNQRNKRAPFR